LLLALYLAIARGRFFWAGVAFMIASLTRFAILFSAPAFVLLALERGRGTPARRRETVLLLLRFAAGACLPTALVLLYNWSVFGDPLINQYTAMWHQKSGTWLRPRNKSLARRTFGITSFKLSNLGKNLLFYTTAHPMRLRWFPYVRFTGSGESLWL